MLSLLKFLGIVFFTTLFFFVLLFFSFPHLSSLRFVNPGLTALMVERGGPVDQRWVPLSKISTHLRRAVVEAEDGNFYRHHGIDLHEVRESLKKNMRKKRFARGFSTITMQVVKNLYLTRQKTLTRKILEILLALKMEQALSKDRILEIYLNSVEWGKGVYGAEAAARRYFKKSALSLSPDEAAFLAAILPNPRRWGHWPPGPFVQRRKEVILTRIGGRPPVKREELPDLPEEAPEETPAPAGPVEGLPETAPETLP